MFCNQCGARNSDDALYCSSCVNSLIESECPMQPPPLNSISSGPQIKNKVPALWNPNAAANWSLVFTPVFGSYLHMKNWEALGNTEKAKSSRTWFISSIILAIIGASFFVLIAWYFSIGKKQCIYVKENFKDEYPRKPWLKPLLIAFSIFIAYIFYYAYSKA